VVVDEAGVVEVLVEVDEDVDELVEDEVDEEVDDEVEDEVDDEVELVLVDVVVVFGLRAADAGTARTTTSNAQA